MIHLYDGLNVMRRATETAQLAKGQMISLRQRFEQTCAAPGGTEIWVWDGRNHNERRRDIYPKYKMNRTPPAEDIYAQINLWKDLLRLTPATQFNSPGWEADDVIATLARRFNKAGVPVTIHSNDMDYAQLTHLPYIFLDGVDTKGVPGRWVPLYKAMVGDKADFIDGIPGFGPGRWEEMKDYWPQIERAIVQGNPAGFAELPFKPAVLAWLQSQENVDLLQAMLTVTHFIEVPDDELEGGIVEGTMNRQAAHELLARYFL